MMDCKDILDAVYVHVRESYISHFYTSNVESKTVTEDVNASENYRKTATEDPAEQTDVTTKENNTDLTQTVRSGVERVDETEIRADIKKNVQEKFPYALASVCSNLAKLDRMYRELKNYESQAEFSEYYLDVGDDFPLSDRFVFPCVMFVSSMILIDIDEKRSDDFYDKYVQATMLISAEMPSELSSIVEKYPY